ncbi:hypothetical protein PEL8287_01723 [Roseovarius litorisediminis]|uniref:Hedgehog/Intein (Hint) domain-containing protein n=1 Tax=Roseovarius litorisediminis TaxID=1312363 RepID=A0A1Y5SAN9_9RHOB|nr:Hint domain-containing protein [Roseovarius litorisediminis]SLN36373.1 hypothetical protein PEL8287_01723 [Roseovarius litorisediminis]
MKPKTVGRDNGKPAAQSPKEINGLMADSIVMTMQGEKQVQDICPGERIITRDSGMAVVKSVRSHTAHMRSVHIKAGSLGHTRPERDVTLSAGQNILIRDWRAQALFGVSRALVPASRLVDGEFVTFGDTITTTLYELSFDRPHVLYVDGLEVASNASETAIAKPKAA